MYDEGTETWWFSVVDVLQVLTERKSGKRYWSDLKRRLAQEAGSEQAYEEIVPLKLTAADGKQAATCGRKRRLEGTEEETGLKRAAFTLNLN